MNKVVVVTGGCRNTGLEIVDRFLRDGAKVFLCGSNDASVADGVRALTARGLAGFRALTCDISRRADVEAMMDVIEKEAGRIFVTTANREPDAAAYFAATGAGSVFELKKPSKKGNEPE